MKSLIARPVPQTSIFFILFLEASLNFLIRAGITWEAWRSKWTRTFDIPTPASFFAITEISVWSYKSWFIPFAFGYGWKVVAQP